MPTENFCVHARLLAFISTLRIAIILLIRFLRKRANRHPMDGQRERSFSALWGRGG
jgi:hypothetical protein